MNSTYPPSDVTQPQMPLAAASASASPYPPQPLAPVSGPAGSTSVYVYPRPTQPLPTDRTSSQHQPLPRPFPPLSHNSQHSPTLHLGSRQHAQAPSPQDEPSLQRQQHTGPHIQHVQLQRHSMMAPPQPLPPARHSSTHDEAGLTSVFASNPHLLSSQSMLVPFSKVDEVTGRKYRLDVVQQPRRARMCGFGDKDRRPITPPPCVRLIITDAATGREIDCNAIDHSMFVLNVDLWNEDGTREVNLVRSSTGSPSISATTPFSYATLNPGDVPMVPYPQHVPPSNRDPAYSYVQDYQMQPAYGQGPPAYAPNGSYGVPPPQQYLHHHQTYHHDGPVSSQASIAHFTRNGVPVAPGYIQDHSSLTRATLMGGQPQGMFTRNLIGSLAASAFRLSDTSDHIGIWFVLQDLSVRTEGSFRLRFSFVNVGARGGGRRDGNAPRINTGRAPILASCFSEVFSVYSAKKFPGVCESTPLSKTFATQGIKIPIRKDANAKGGDEDDYGE